MGEGYRLLILTMTVACLRVRKELRLLSQPLRLWTVRCKQELPLDA